VVDTRVRWYDHAVSSYRPNFTAPLRRFENRCSMNDRVLGLFPLSQPDLVQELPISGTTRKVQKIYQTAWEPGTRALELEGDDNAGGVSGPSGALQQCPSNLSWISEHGEHPPRRCRCFGIRNPSLAYVFLVGPIPQTSFKQCFYCGSCSSSICEGVGRDSIILVLNFKAHFEQLLSAPFLYLLAFQSQSFPPFVSIFVVPRVASRLTTSGYLGRLEMRFSQGC
jgi:hypothetical protein